MHAWAIIFDKISINIEDILVKYQRYIVDIFKISVQILTNNLTIQIRFYFDQNVHISFDF